MAAPPNTTVQLSHAMAIRAAGQTIGAINSWAPKQTRSISELYEFGQGVSSAQFGLGNGEPFAKVPNNVSGMTIDVNRYDLYPRRMETAFGTADLSMLSSQNSELELREGWVSPNNENNYSKVYSGCWFSSIGRTITATGERIVNVSATIEYTAVSIANAI